MAFHKAGQRVIGMDNDPRKVAALRRGESYLKHLGEEEVKGLAASERFRATSEPAEIADADAILVCVPTPLNEAHEPDLSFVTSTMEVVAAQLKARSAERTPALVVLESTTYPGTTRELVKPILDKVRAPYLLGYSPERVDPGRAEPLEGIPKIVAGIDEASKQAATDVYGRAFARVVPVSSCEVAEAAKLLENIYRAVNIALVNEMKVVLERLGIDIWEVLDAAATKPYGYQRFDPGPGLGGHCIPIDPFYLAWKARSAGIEARFIELAGRVNHEMPGRVAEIALRAMGGARRADGSARQVLILGLAYKPNIDDVRESPSFELIDLLTEAGCSVEYSDPHVPRTHFMRRWGDLNKESVQLTPGRLAQADAVIVATAHSAFDWAAIALHSALIIDTRNALAAFPNARVVKA